MTRSVTQQLTETGTNSVIFTITNVEWQLIYAHCVYTPSGNAGNRIVVLELLDSNNVVIGDWHCTPVIAATTERHVEFMPGTYRESTFDAHNTVQTPFPQGLTVPEGYKIRIRDTANIDSSGDSLTANLQVAKSAP